MKKEPIRGTYHQGRVRASDDTQIYYNVLGDGTPPLVLSSGIGCDQFIWKYIAKDFAPRHRIVRWNYRGHGLSGRPSDPERVTMTDVLDDLRSVMDASEVEKGILLGHSMGVQVCLEFHRQHPERVLALVLICGSYGNPLDTLHGNDTAADLLPLLTRVVNTLPNVTRHLWRKLTPTRLSYKLASLAEINPLLAQRGDFMPYLEHLAEVDPSLFLKMLASLQEHTSEPHLANVDVPTLVVAGQRDRFTPSHLSDKMTRLIPGSELLVIPGGTHIAPLEMPELMNLKLEKFIHERLSNVV